MTSPSTERLVADYHALVDAGGAAVSTRDVVAVTGPDAARYLQGQLSQDVVAMVGDSAWSFLLAPTGKVDAWLRVHRIDPEHYLLETDPGYGEVVLARLKRFLLRTKASIAAPESLELVQQRWDASLVRFDDEVHDGVLSSSPVGPGVAGRDFLILNSATQPATELAGAVVVPGAMQRYRIAHGIPAMGSELNEDTIPGEAGAWVIDASVSFTKGCYTGQELVARIDSRGNNVPHPIRVLVLDADAAIGDDVNLDGTTVGSITSVVPSLHNELPALALARVGRNVVPGSEVSIRSGSNEFRAIAVEPGSVR